MVKQPWAMKSWKRLVSNKVGQLPYRINPKRQRMRSPLTPVRWGKVLVRWHLACPPASNKAWSASEPVVCLILEDESEQPDRPDRFLERPLPVWVEDSESVIRGRFT